MLKNTAPAARPREPTAEELKDAQDRVIARVQRLNRITFLAGMLTADQLEGAIVLLEASTQNRRALEGLTFERATGALAWALPAVEW